MNDYFVLDKATMASVIEGLKSLDLHTYEDYCKIVGIVTLLEQVMLRKPQEDSKAEEVTE